MTDVATRGVSELDQSLPANRWPDNLGFEAVPFFSPPLTTRTVSTGECKVKVKTAQHEKKDCKVATDALVGNNVLKLIRRA